MTKQEKVAAWMESLGFQLHKWPGGNVYQKGGMNDLFHLTEDQATFFYDVTQEAEKAFGGCHKCFGKGYAATLERSPADTETRIIDNLTTTVQFCTCERGEHLSALMKSLETATRIDQTLLLKSAQEKFGKIDFAAALYELKDRQTVAGQHLKQSGGEDE